MFKICYTALTERVIRDTPSICGLQVPCQVGQETRPRGVVIRGRCGCGVDICCGGVSCLLVTRIPKENMIPRKEFGEDGIGGRRGQANRLVPWHVLSSSA